MLLITQKIRKLQLQMKLNRTFSKSKASCCRELGAQRSLKLGMKVISMAMLNQDRILKRNLYFALDLMFQPSCCFHLGRIMFFLHQSWNRLRRLQLLPLFLIDSVSCLISLVLIQEFNFDVLYQIATRMVIQYGWGPDDSPTIYHHGNMVFPFL